MGKSTGPQTGDARQKTLSDKEFVTLLRVHDDVNDKFWAHCEVDSSQALKELGFYWRPFTLKPVWAKKYDIEAVRNKCKEFSPKVQALSTYYHALGIMDFFRTEEGVSEFFPNTVSSVVGGEFAQTPFTLLRQNGFKSLAHGWHNLYLLQSLLNALNQFINEYKPGSDERSILEESREALVQSIAYYTYYSENGSMPRKQILSDLQKQKTRIFSTGRSSKYDFHAMNIILSKDHLVICDRFDVNETDYYSVIRSEGMMAYTERVGRETGRNPSDGIYVYELEKPFSKLSKAPLYPKGIHKQFLHWATESIDKYDSIYELHQYVTNYASIEADFTLPAKKQSKGNCRYASKKQGVVGLMLVSALSKVKDPKAAIAKVTALQKEFKRFDRMQKIKEFILDKNLSLNDKDQLLILTLLRNNNPENQTDKAIWAEIIPHLQKRIKEEPSLLKVLDSIFVKLGTAFHDKKNEANLKRLESIQNRLISAGILCATSGSPRPKPALFSPELSSSSSSTSLSSTFSSSLVFTPAVLISASSTPKDTVTPGSTPKDSTTPDSTPADSTTPPSTPSSPSKKPKRKLKPT